MLTRRKALIGMSSGLVMVASGARGQGMPTPSSDIGPFYPAAYRDEADNDLTLIRGRSGRAAG